MRQNEFEAVFLQMDSVPNLLEPVPSGKDDFYVDFRHLRVRITSNSCTMITNSTGMQVTENNQILDQTRS